MSGDLRRQIAEALAEKFTTDTGQRNPNWNPEQDESPDNPYHLTVPMAERVNRAPYVSWVAGDGCRSFSSPSCGDLADECDYAARLQDRRAANGLPGDQPETTARRYRAVADELRAALAPLTAEDQA